MKKRYDRRMLSAFSAALAEKELAAQFTISKRGLQDLLQMDDWLTRFAALERNSGRYCCADILAAAADTLARLSPVPEAGWLDFCYRFAVDRLYPNSEFAVQRQKHGAGALFLLTLMQVLFDEEREREAFDWRLDFDWVEPTDNSESSVEYRRFCRRWRRDYVYELMRLGREIMPYQTLSHIAGVHHVALQVARDLCAAGIAVDLPLLSGAAMAHDIGKFGCRPGERVPYLHYYYTDVWCQRIDTGRIGHIAANHSVWDLELENLTVESLLLIYADFRVKQVYDAEGRESSQIFSLQDSFDVILGKLDQVDEAKRRRYELVYARLHDFEELMRARGVDVALSGSRPAPQPAKDPALMDAAETVEALKFLAISHNIDLMRQLATERGFGNVLEAARSEKEWHDLRAYLHIFEEYFTYLDRAQKAQTLAFLYELLMHREGDIRRQAAALIGNIIAHFDEGYRKELPAGVLRQEGELAALLMWKKYVEMIVLPDYKLTAQHKSWIGYALKLVITSVLEHVPAAEREIYLSVFLAYFRQPGRFDDRTAFVLLDTLSDLSLRIALPAEDLPMVIGFAFAAAGRQPLELRVAALRVLRRVMEQPHGTEHCRQAVEKFALDFDDGGLSVLIFLKGRLLRALGQSDEAQQQRLAERDIVADIFLENLKMATPWVVKAVNIRILLDQIRRGDHRHLLHIAAHFSNLVKVSERVVVRHDAGAGLLAVAPLLTQDQRNEIAVELAKGLEVGEYEFSKYIPEYLGAFSLWLHPRELDEMIARLAGLLGSASDSVVSVALATVGVLFAHYSEYASRFAEEDTVRAARQERLLGMLLKGLASYRDAVHQEALLVIGSLFAGDAPALPEKQRIFVLCHQKLLFLISENMEGRLTFYYRAAALSHLYRFISRDLPPAAAFAAECRDRIAFFPGSFDPFSLSHKGIVEVIRDLGFEVMLAIDEFSWSKKMQPRLIRRRIASMSVADMFHVQVFPDAVPVNLANPADLRELRRLLPGKRVYIVVGSDVVANAQSYRAAAQPDSIHQMDHIVFLRAGTADEAALQPNDALQVIRGEVIELSLPMHLEDISSTRIRENIDHNRDISNLIDVAAQDYIYRYGLYLREPQYKPLLRSRAIRFEALYRPTAEETAARLLPILSGHAQAEEICRAVTDCGSSLTVMRNGERSDAPVGFISFREIASAELFAELGDLELAAQVRGRAAGRLILISGIYVAPDSGIDDGAQWLLSEALAAALAKDCTYALFHPCHAQLGGKAALSALQRQGFLPMADSTQGRQTWLVDMRSPVVLIQNMETTIKEPFSSSSRILAAIRGAHRSLQTAMTALYPGELVLSLSSGIIHHRLIDKITAINGVPTVPTQPRQLGPDMCVPFGKILRGSVVPNTVTKTLHTDKYYNPDLSRHNVGPYPFYSPLESQVRVIKSFARPVILVDDLLHNSARLSTLDSLFRAQEINVRMVLVGLLSGNGRDLATSQGYPVDGVYYVPNLRHWFVESTLYPFIGGDTVRREGSRTAAGLIPAVNQILPYATPFFARYCSPQTVFSLSQVCLENTHSILRALEAEYRQLFERNLTLETLSETIHLPLCPDKGGCMAYDPNLAASVYVENDIEQLMRMKRMYCGWA